MQTLIGSLGGVREDQAQGRLQLPQGRHLLLLDQLRRQSPVPEPRGGGGDDKGACWRSTGRW